MPLETITYISDLVAANPTTSDGLVEGDDHLRGIKAALRNSLPGLVGTTAATTAALDALQAAYVVGKAWIPAGFIGHFLKGTTPSGGWLPLTGGTYNYDDYPALGAYVGATVHGTFTLPDVESTGRFLRSKTAAVTVGTTQSSQNKTHTHTGTVTSGGTTSGENVGHTHGFTGTTDGQSNDHAHSQAYPNNGNTGVISAGGGTYLGGAGTGNTGGSSADHHHTFTGTTGDISNTHTHTVSVAGGFTTDPDGGTEARPESLVVSMWVKT
jgi:hypothetical protein